MKDSRASDPRSDCLPDDPHLNGSGDRDLSAAELARVEAHLAECDECAQEMRATVALLRSLPDPEPPARLVADVMRRIEAGEGRRPRIVEWLHIAGQPRFAAAFAAAAAALVLITSSEFEPGRLVISRSSDELFADAPVPASATDAEATKASRPPSLPPAFEAGGISLQREPRPRVVAFESVVPPQWSATQGSSQPLGFFSRASAEVPLRDLDGELDALMANPTAFLERVRRTSVEARRPMFAPLVEHSARRGSFAAVAGQLGAAQPVAVPVSTR